MADVKTVLERYDVAIKHANEQIEDIIPEVVEAVTHGDYDDAIDLLMEIKKCEILMEVVEQVKNVLSE